MPRINRWSEPLNNVPAWRIVEFPTGQRFVYEDLEHANTARIIARAWFNYEKQVGWKVGWASFARYLNYLRPRKPKRPNISDKEGRPFVDARGGLSYAISDKLYGNVLRGTMPKDLRVANLLIELSGWPWE